MHLQQPFNLKAVTTMNVDKRKTQVEVLEQGHLPIILMMKSLSVLLNMHIYSVERFT